MKAVVITGPNAVEVQEHDTPSLKPGELLIRTEYSGVSQGTELQAFTGKRPELSFPTVPGYQAVGTVEAAGREATFRPGQRVVFSTSRMPESLPETWMGAHVSHAVVPTTGHRAPIPLPEGTDSVAAALAALAAVSLRGLRMVPVGPGDLVVVVGQGLIGQGSAQLARLRGASVIAADIAPGRLELSRRCSADYTVDVSAQALAEVVRATKPGGADVVVETTGRSEQFARCVDLLREQGHLLLQGYYSQPISFDFHLVHLKRPTVAITCGFDATETAEVLELMRGGGLNFRDLATHVVPYTDAPAIYPRLLAGDPDILGVVFDWTRE